MANSRQLLPRIGLPLRNRFREAGFTAVELVIIVSVILVMSTVVVVRVRDARANAQSAKDQANVSLVQGTYERAKLLHPEILSNENLSGFIVSARQVGLISKDLAPDDMARVALAQGTSITGQTALFILGTNALSQNTNLPPAPTVQITSPAAGAQLPAGSFTLSAAAVAPQSAVTRVDFYAGSNLLGSVTAPPYTLTATAPIGSQVFTVKAYNAFGTYGTATVSVNFVQNNPPTVVLASPAPGAYLYTSPLSLAANASDPDVGDTLSRVEFLVNGEVLVTDTAAPFSYSWIAPVGSYSIKARAYDGLGLMAESQVNNVTVYANTAPSVSVTSPTNNQVVDKNSSIHFRANATDTDAADSITKVEFYLDGALLATDTSYQYEYQWTASTVGNHTLFAVAYDMQGTTATNTATFKVNTPPSLALTAPSSGAVVYNDVTTTISATASDPDAGDGIATVKFYAGTILLSTDTTSPYSYNWTGAAAANYNLKAVATDLNGRSSTSAVVTVQVLAPSSLVWSGFDSGSYISGSDFTGTGLYKDAWSSQTLLNNGRVEFNPADNAYFHFGLAPIQGADGYSAYTVGLSASSSAMGGLQVCNVKVPGSSYNNVAILGGSDTIVIELSGGQCRLYIRKTDGTTRWSSAWGSVSGQTLYPHMRRENSTLRGVTSGTIYR